MQLTDLIVKFNADGRTAILTQPLVMSWKSEDGKTMTLSVPAGFETDFASIPQAIRSMLPQLGRWTAPAVVHDWLYYTGMLNSQSASDDALNQLMKEANVRTFNRLAIYSGLKIGGWVAYGNHRKDGHSLLEWYKTHGGTK